ncbi:2-oxoglutarate dehydrogenase, E2 component, dihydrolipoamide succinyltransferase [Nocardiopsis sp. ATB16-24]|uniref:2-oxoglutarate dehydrogenase, E2 component, dihydrolipoamide succinyltransferase n=1 Tax=Nocardiopsis sp. ATB16-24 TaxID=3019555 RepID=UPI0025550386|nr:2-oxoglutarate dehydrogenase, E2 component, dihydrolipoamide succinyltransferase [Nocardiopsis sp. ATB16-24]
MPTTVSMPALGESVTEGTVTQWLKNVGDTVEVDEPLLEVSTDKVDTEIPSPAAGVLTQILVEEDETVEIGAQIAVIGDEGESAAGSDDDTGAEASQPAAEAEPEPEPEPEAEVEPEPEPEPESAPAAPQESSSSGPTTSVTMPALGESVTEGTVTQWLKNVGDTVEVDEPLLEVSTDKVDTEIPSPAAGVLTQILVEEDETVEIGAQIAVIGGTGDEPPAVSEAPAPPRAEPEPEPAPEPESEPEPEPEPEPAAPQAAKPARDEQADEGPSVDVETLSGTGRASGTDAGAEAYVTPLVRRLAAEHGVELSRVSGTGVGGRIRKQDVLKAAEERKSASPAAASTPRQATTDTSLRGRTEKLTRLRLSIADRMVESLHVSATTTQVIEVDVTKIARLLEQVAERGDDSLDFFPFFALATVGALRAHPKLNAVIDGDRQEVTYHDVENLGVAVDTERGLLAPVVREAGRLGLSELAHKITDLSERAHTGRLGPDELGGGTFTIAETGNTGALFGTPIINQPQVAILSTGAVVKRPVVVADPSMGGEVIAVRSMVYLSLAHDHRLIDNADAGRFLQTIKERLEEGAFESELGLS